MKALLAPAALALCTFLAACKPQPAVEAPAVAPTPVQPAAAAAPAKVRLKTSKGDIVVELDRAKAPVTVENFLSYVGSKHYDGTVFHRVIDGFMIQGGGYALDGGRLTEKPTGKGIKNESTNGLKNLRGTIAMARTPDPDSATAQFFINVVDNPALDYPSNGGYAVFGKVVEGMNVADEIRVVPTGPGDVPTQPVVITSAAVEP